MNKISFTPEGWEDYEWWDNQDKKTIKKIKRLIKELQRHPFEGEGKPEPLVGDLTGLWSRRISKADRMVYRVEKDVVTIHQLRTHYKK